MLNYLSGEINLVTQWLDITINYVAFIFGFFNRGKFLMNYGNGILFLP